MLSFIRGINDKARHVDIYAGVVRTDYPILSHGDLIRYHKIGAPISTICTLQGHEKIPKAMMISENDVFISSAISNEIVNPIAFYESFFIQSGMTGAVELTLEKHRVLIVMLTRQVQSGAIAIWTPGAPRAVIPNHLL